MGGVGSKTRPTPLCPIASKFRTILRSPPHPARLSGTHNNPGVILAREGDIKGAIEHYRMTLRDGRFWIQTANDPAWFLATAPDATLRDPTEAVRLATRAAELSGRRNPAILNTLAGALAANGQYDQAVAIGEQALVLAMATRKTSLAAQLRERVQLYRQRRPDFRGRAERALS